MSYAIIRNEKYKRENLKGIYRHNERRNKNYSNKNINQELSYLNYSLKDCKHSYEKEFELIREKYNLKGQIKSVSNIVCEYIITSDKEFFNSIGSEETKRYFETVYKFVCGYKDLGEQYILSAKVHMDEETPHMHLVFIPVVHTQDKKGNNIDKIACSEFWKEKDSYRQLQDAFYNYIKANNFNLERGKEEARVHLSIEEYKKITGFENSKTVLQDIELQLPDVPNIKDFSKIMLGRDEKIEELIIKPKDKLIEKLHEENCSLHHELYKQCRLVDKAEKYEKERQSILAENKEIKENLKTLENDYSIKLKQEIRKLENKYEDEIYNLNKENIYLSKIIITLKKTVNKFIKWIAKKFDIAEEDNLIRNFQKETNTFIDPEKQIKHEEMEKEWDLEL
ncbi:MAG TPA: hypothetical protein DCZ30_08025 [Clostridiales bacterium]|nr:hypothetical protein [Clostridiales bacterium]